MQEEVGRIQGCGTGAAARTRKTLLIMSVLLLAFGLLSRPAAAYANSPPQPLATPQITSCAFVPDSRSNTSIACGEDRSNVPGYVNATVRFVLNVSDFEGEAMNVTFYFDVHIDFDPISGFPFINTTGSPSTNVTIGPQGPGVNATVETNRTYDRLSADQPVPGIESKYWVFAKVNDSAGADPDSLGCSLPYGNCLFPVYIIKNTPSSLGNLSSFYEISDPITFPDRTIPPVSIDIAVTDEDNDAVTVTWDWGDGRRDVYLVGPAGSGVNITANHTYEASALPLNLSNHDFLFHLTIWADDGIPGHNQSAETSAVNFYISTDSRPNRPTVLSPDPLVHWKVNETIPMEGFATDPEGDPITVYYWDFDDRVDTDLDGNPATDRDAVGNVTSHAYSAPGNYNATLWATDGEDKRFCLNATDPDCSQYLDHWTSFPVELQVRFNQVPLALVESISGDGLVGEPVSLHVSVWDSDADPLNVTWDFGDSTTAGYNLTGGDRRTPTLDAYPDLFQSHAYAASGNYTVTVRVRDGWDETVRNVTVFVQSQNLPPRIIPPTIFHSGNESLGGNQFRFNETVYIRINVTDPENDPVDLEVDWGDGNVTRLTLTGTTVVVNTTEVQAECAPVDGDTSCVLSHAYRSYGTFRISMTLTDHQTYITRARNETTGNYTYSILTHTILLTVTVDVPAPPIRRDPGPWDWWDTSTLALVLGIPGLLIGRDVWRNIRERREE